jgi:hypothetical protein
MATKPRKLSETMKEMSEILLRHPGEVPSSEAMHVALFFANVAWNECVGLGDSREGYRNVWETIEAENPELWNEFNSNDIDAMGTGPLITVPSAPTVGMRTRPVQGGALPG